MQQPITQTSIPTLPSTPALARPGGDRSALFAALTFIDRPPRHVGELVAWLDKHLVGPGRMRRPGHVTEGFSTPVELPATVGLDDAGEIDVELRGIVDAARHRTLVTLRAFLPPASDERFLVAAVEQGRVRQEKDASWTPCPGESDLLSDIVLSLFAADILSYREFHDAYLCVCKTCLRIDFDPQRSGRTGCPDHQPTAALGALRRSPPLL